MGQSFPLPNGVKLQTCGVCAECCVQPINDGVGVCSSEARGREGRGGVAGCWVQCYGVWVCSRWVGLINLFMGVHVHFGLLETNYVPLQ